jgi:hypothetical protein
MLIYVFFVAIPTLWFTTGAVLWHLHVDLYLLSGNVGFMFTTGTVLWQLYVALCLLCGNAGFMALIPIRPGGNLMPPYVFERREDRFIGSCYAGV